MRGDRPLRTGSTIVKHSIVVAGHATSISLEDAFWDGLKAIAEERRSSVASLVALIDTARGVPNLSSAIRVFVLDHFQGATARGASGSKADPVPSG